MIPYRIIVGFLHIRVGLFPSFLPRYLLFLPKNGIERASLCTSFSPKMGDRTRLVVTVFPWRRGIERASLWPSFKGE